MSTVSTEQTTEPRLERAIAEADAALDRMKVRRGELEHDERAARQTGDAAGVREAKQALEDLGVEASALRIRRNGFALDLKALRSAAARAVVAEARRAADEAVANIQRVHQDYDRCLTEANEAARAAGVALMNAEGALSRVEREAI